jgi:hypothetical protein
MTEAEWLAATDPALMLEWLRHQAPERLQGNAGERKLILFCVACCLADAMADDHPARYQALLQTEVYADVPNTPVPDYWRSGEFWPAQPLKWATVWSQDDETLELPTLPIRALLLRDIFRNPFRAGPEIDSVCLAWQGGTVARLAQAAYDERQLPEGTLDPARLAVLADALEDAGCTDTELLGHLHSPGPHVRGCWALDAVLGKK